MGLYPEKLRARFTGVEGGGEPTYSYNVDQKRWNKYGDFAVWIVVARGILRKTPKSRTGQRKYLQIGKSLLDGLIIGTIARPINLYEQAQ